jgi:DNA-binding NarL/FixJ family response regulator
LLRQRVDVFVLVAVRLYRDGIADALTRDARFRVVGRAGALADAHVQLERLPCAPDVSLVDLALPEGAGAARSLRAARPATGIVALAVPEADDEIVRLAEAGVDGLTPLRVSRRVSRSSRSISASSASRPPKLVSTRSRSQPCVRRSNRKAGGDHKSRAAFRISSVTRLRVLSSWL